MDTFSSAIRYLFIISVLLVIVAYWKGFTEDTKTLFSSAGDVIYKVTGRNAQGQFANYPGGA